MIEKDVLTLLLICAKWRFSRYYGLDCLLGALLSHRQMGISVMRGGQKYFAL